MDHRSDLVRAAVERMVREQPSFAGSMPDIRVEEAQDEAGQPFLRVLLRMHLPQADMDDQLEILLERIEEVVAQIDDRYPSVRFLDAA